MNQTSKCGIWLATSPVVWGSVCASLLALACGSDGGAANAPADESALPEPEQTDNAPAPPEGDSSTTDPAPAPEPAAPAEPEASAPPPADVDATPPPVARCTDSLSFDDLYAAIDADLRDEGDEDAAFVRYVSLSHRLNQGICPEDLERDRQALVKTLNSLSTQVGVVVPEAIDEDGIVYRIDLRDLGWEEPVQVGGVDFENKWEAIIASSAYAVELEGGDADSAKLAAQTAVPVLFLDALIDASVVGDVYYALVDIGEDAFDLFAQLGIDFADTPVRAGTGNSRMSQQDTIIQRFDTGLARGFYWSRFDVADGNAGQSIFANPFGFGGDVIASLFTLPNGFIAYALFDAAGVRLADTDVLVDQFQRDGRVRNSVSCSACHAAGVNPVTDQVRAYVESNPRDFDNATFSDVQEQFVLQPELDDVIGRDVAAYRATLDGAGLDSAGVDLVNSVYQRFDGPVTLEAAAGELGLTPDDFSRDLVALSNEADPALATLRTQNLRREQFDAAYLATLCSVLISSDNRPVAADCDAAP